MTIKDLVNTVKFDFNIKNTDYAQKNYSKDNNNGFLNVFESANKSYNFSFKETEKFSYKNLNQYNENKNFNSREFKSDYENYYNKLDTNKNIDNSIKKEAISQAKDTVSEAKEDRKEAISQAKKTVSEAKEDRKEVISQIKDTVSEAKEDKKEVLSETKEAVSEAKEDKKEVISETKEAVSEVKDETTKLNPEENTAIVENINLNNVNIIAQTNLPNVNTNLNQQEQPQTVLQNTDEANVILQKNNNTTELQADKPENSLPEELTALQKQIANEKIINKQAENLLQQTPAEVEEETPEDQPQIAKINPEELKKTEAKITDQPAKQDQSQKPEILASEDVLNKINTVDKTQIKQPQSENLKPVSEKMAAAINNEDAKPVITNIEVQNNSSKMDSDGQSQKQSQQELKANINQIQTVSPEENNLQKIDLQKTSQFDKILNTKQSQTLENSVLNQLKDKISSDITTNKSQITIALRPDNLGKVNINLVSQNGVLTAQITAENKQVKDILNKSLETLRQNMAEQGITVGKMVVNVQESASSNQNMHSENNQKNFEQANSNTSNMNSHSDKQNHSEESASAYSDNQLYGFDEESENEMGELAGEKIVLHSGTVDYKI